MGAAADAVLYRKLRIQIPRLHLTALIVRVAQTLLIISLSCFYALSGPEVFYDVFIWDPIAAQDPPYNITFHRNMPPPGHLADQEVTIGNLAGWSTTTIPWNTSGIPEIPDLGDSFLCPKGWMNCNGSEWAATRLSWLDSWPVGEVPSWLSDVVYLDRYIFWVLMAGGFLAVGHNLIVFAHAIEPSGVNFYKYIAAMDFFISLVYLLLGVFPLSILSGLKGALPSQLGLSVGGFSQYMWDLEPSQKYAFVLGWVMWGLYATSGILNCAVIVGINKYMRLRGPVKKRPASEPPEPGIAGPDPEILATGFEGGNVQRNSTISRHGGRSMV